MKVLAEALLVALLFSVLVSTVCLSPVQASGGWTQLYGGHFNDRVDFLIQTSDGGYAIAGNHYISAEELADFWIIKTNSSGYVEWSQRYNRTDTHFGIGGLVQTSDGGYAIAGRAVDANQNYTISMIRINGTGHLLWDKKIGYGPRDFANTLTETSDGGFAIAGSTLGYAGSSDFWLIKVAANGTLEWDHKYGGVFNDEASSLVEMSDGGFAIAGSTYSTLVDNSSAYNPMFIRTYPNGSTLFWQIYGSQEQEIAHVLVTTSDGGYALAGVNFTFSNFDFDYWLIKTNADGNIVWRRNYEGLINGYADHVGLVTTSDGGLSLAGSKGSWPEGIDTFLLKTDASGNAQWNQTHSLPDYDMDCGCLVVTADGGFAIAGQTNYFDIFLIKTDAYGVVPEFSTALAFIAILCLLSITVIALRRRANSPKRSSSGNAKVKLHSI